jgi:hypothetical protein
LLTHNALSTLEKKKNLFTHKVVSAELKEVLLA